MSRLIKTLLFGCLVIINSGISAQPFAKEIAAFKKQDAISFPSIDGILFIGSSSFTKWKDVQNYFPGYPIINRGFGGSSLPDMIRYENDIIFPYLPKQIVIYCGENDVASSDTITAKIVFQRFKKLFTDIRATLQGIPIVFVSLKPSPSRWQMKDRMKAANKYIKKYLTKKKKTDFVNVWDAMLDGDGNPMKDIFLSDNLHMNAKGYVIWQKLIAPYLLK